MSQVDELQSSIDIVELVRRYTNLKKAGTNYKALCPFPGHSEKTPSFIVSPSKQIAYCFGCHKGGGPLKFIMDVENCEFREALEILSSITGIKLKGYDKEQEILKKNIYTLFKSITSYYQNALSQHPEVESYLSNRGITLDSISKFQLGYANSGTELYRYLESKGFTQELIDQSNVFINAPIKKDKFIGRMIFPIQGLRGDVVGFAGRIIDVGEPKYLNSPASPVYDKSSILYGLYHARNAIAKQGYAIITEGYMDVISLHQNGFPNSVCVSGTALTPKHVEVLKKLTGKIYLCFDSDDAGRKATEHAIETLKNRDIETKIILLPKGKDPDDIIKSGKDFGEFISQALTPIGFGLHFYQKSHSLQDTKKALNYFLSIISGYKNSIEQDFYLKEVSQTLGIKLDIVYNEYNKLGYKKTNTPSISSHHFLTSEELLIGYSIKYPEKREFIYENILYKDTIGAHLKALLTDGIQALDSFDLETKNTYLALSQNDEALEIQAQLESQGGKNQESIESILQKTLHKYNLDNEKQIKASLKEKIDTGDLEALKKYQELLKSKKT